MMGHSILNSYLTEQIVNFGKNLRVIGYQPGTIALYRLRVEDFLSWCADDDKAEPLDGITQQDIESFLEECRQRQGNRKVTLKGKLMALRSFFRFLVSVKKIKIDPTANIHLTG